jgi:hypothetical protein
MRFFNPLILLVVAVFIIGIGPTKALAKKPPKPDPLEQRVTDLETNDALQDDQLQDHETRIQNEEASTTGQNQRLDSLEAEQEVQNNRLDALETQPPPAAGIRVVADNGDFLGILVNIALDPNTGVTTYIPNLGKFLELRNTNDITSGRTTVSLYYDQPLCTGTVYYMPRECDICESHPNFLFANENSFYEQIGDTVGRMHYSKKWPDGTCDATGSNDPIAPVEVVPVDFTYPIVTPIKFE